MLELLEPAVWLTVGITVAFVAVVVVGVFALRRYIARRNPEIDAS
ncbi:hypothetical protein [Agrococcus sp. HG114]|nr:hypothetical protein [Agrococcus sp. HG114]MCR8671378.1 hypothetical protein [Agrococcus sp. HG114]